MHCGFGLLHLRPKVVVSQLDQQISRFHRLIVGDCDLCHQTGYFGAERREVGANVGVVGFLRLALARPRFQLPAIRTTIPPAISRIIAGVSPVLPGTTLKEGAPERKPLNRASRERSFPLTAGSRCVPAFPIRTCGETFSRSGWMISVIATALAATSCNIGVKRTKFSFAADTDFNIRNPGEPPLQVQRRINGESHRRESECVCSRRSILHPLLMRPEPMPTAFFDRPST